MNHLNSIPMYSLAFSFVLFSPNILIQFYLILSDFYFALLPLSFFNHLFGWRVGVGVLGERRKDSSIVIEHANVLPSTSHIRDPRTESCFAFLGKQQMMAQVLRSLPSHV